MVFNALQMFVFFLFVAQLRKKKSAEWRIYFPAVQVGYDRQTSFCYPMATHTDEDEF